MKLRLSFAPHFPLTFSFMTALCLVFVVFAFCVVMRIAGQGQGACFWFGLDRDWSSESLRCSPYRENGILDLDGCLLLWLEEGAGRGIEKLGGCMAVRRGR